MKTTRQRILDLIENRRATTAPELARALHLTPANIRHHLRVLSEDGLVARTGMRKTAGRGRPTGIYGLVTRQDNYQKLSEALLDLLPESPAGQELGLAKTGERLAGPAAPHGSHITQRLVHAMQRLEALHYRPRWEAHPGAPEVILEHCPYSEIIADHPELCQVDRHLLQSLTGAPCRQTHKLEPTPQGNRICRFRLG